MCTKETQLKSIRKDLVAGSFGFSGNIRVGCELLFADLPPALAASDFEFYFIFALCIYVTKIHERFQSVDSLNICPPATIHRSISQSLILLLIFDLLPQQTSAQENNRSLTQEIDCGWISCVQ